MSESAVSQPEGRVRIETAVHVGNAGARQLFCDVFHPPGPPPSAGYPAVLLIHGGAWARGDRSQLRGYGIRLARRGFLCATAEYRLSGEAKWPAQLHDVKAALRFLHAQAERLRVDPARIAVSGNSAGGHLALMLAATAGDSECEGQSGQAEGRSSCAACIAFYPPTKLFGDRSPIELARGLFAADVTQATARHASPIEHARRDFVPCLLIHGNQDDIVSPEASLSMHRALASAGARVELHMFDGAAHGFDAERDYGRLCAELMVLFLQRHL